MPSDHIGRWPPRCESAGAIASSAQIVPVARPQQSRSSSRPAPSREVGRAIADGAQQRQFPPALQHIAQQDRRQAHGSQHQPERAQAAEGGEVGVLHVVEARPGAPRWVGRRSRSRRAPLPAWPAASARALEQEEADSLRRPETGAGSCSPRSAARLETGCPAARPRCGKRVWFEREFLAQLQVQRVVRELASAMAGIAPSGCGFSSSSHGFAVFSTVSWNVK